MLQKSLQHRLLNWLGGLPAASDHFRRCACRAPQNRYFHAEGLEDVLFKKNVQRFSGRNLHHAAQNIEGDPAIPALPGLKFKGYLRQAVDNLLKRPIVGFKIGMTRLIEIRPGLPNP